MLLDGHACVRCVCLPSPTSGSPHSTHGNVQSENTPRGSDMLARDFSSNLPDRQTGEQEKGKAGGGGGGGGGGKARREGRVEEAESTRERETLMNGGSKAYQQPPEADA